MSFQQIALGTTLILSSAAIAGLDGEVFHLVTEVTDSPFLPGGQIIDLGNFVVGEGIEWSSTFLVYDYQEPGAPVVGEYTYSFDVGDDYIHTTVEWTTYVVPGHDNPFLNYFSLLPGDFYGYHLTFENATNLSADHQLQVSAVNAPAVHMGDLNLFEVIDPKLEAWVDSQYVDPTSPTRITAVDNTLDLNFQGIAWGMFWATEGIVYTETTHIDLVFECHGDTTGDGVVDVADILQLIGAWGPCGICAEDLNNDGNVDVADLLDLLSAWGPCP
jgi:hypothetical protein